MRPRCCSRSGSSKKRRGPTPRSGSSSPKSEVLNPGLDVSLFDLVKTFQTVLERAKNRPIYEVGKEDVNVPDMIRFLRDTLMRIPRSQPLSVTELFERQRSGRAMLCLFLAILELVKRQAIHLQQKEAFGDILVQAQPTTSKKRSGPSRRSQPRNRNTTNRHGRAGPRPTGRDGRSSMTGVRQPRDRGASTDDRIPM